MERFQQMIFLGILCVGFILILFNSGFAQSSSGELPLSDFLTENGTFQNPNGYSGSLNPAGFNLSVAEDGTPVFRRNINNDSNEYWESFGEEEVNGDVRALLVYDNILFIGGFFSGIGEISANSIARYNFETEKWSTFGDGIEGYDDRNGVGLVNAITVLDDFLYAGGNFNQAGGKEANHIARYNLKEDDGNASWSGFGRVYRDREGRNDWPASINDMIVHENSLIVSGHFAFVNGHGYSSSGSADNSIARFDTATDTWSGFGDGIERDFDEFGIIDALTSGLAIIDDYLYVSLYVESPSDTEYAGGNEIQGIGRYNLKEDKGNSSWSALPGEDPGLVNDIVPKDNDLIIAGSFEIPTASFVDKIGRFNTINNDWRIYDGDIDYYVNELELFGNTLFVGGSIISIDGESINGILQLNLESGEWSSLGDGVNSIVSAMAVSGKNLYVGGDFTTAGGKPASRIARWSGVPVVPPKLLLYTPEDNSDGLSIRPKLNWQYSEEADSYELIVSESEYFSDPVIHKTKLDPSSHQIAVDLDYNTTYYWKVRGSNENGSGPWSQSWSFTTTSPGPVPDQVTLLSPENSETGIPLRPELVWNTADDAEDYRVILSETSDFSNPVIDQVDIEGTSFQVLEDLSQGKLYYWRVRGENDSSEGPWSETWSFTTVALPAQVHLSSPVNGSEDIELQPELTWQMADKAQRYNIVVSANSDFSDPAVQASDLSETTFQVAPGLAYNTTYYWQVRGVNEQGNGPWSNTWTFTTIPPPLPGQVSLLSPASNSIDISINPQLIWESSGKTQSYELILSEDPEFSNPFVHQTDLQETTFTASEELSYSQTYYWKVRGLNMYGEGQWSDVWSFTTIAPTEIALAPNWPNPFSKTVTGTNIRYELPEETEVHLEVYNISGQRVAILVDKVMPAGQHDVLFYGAGLADGVYFYRLVTSDKSVIRKMTLMK